MTIRLNNQTERIKFHVLPLNSSQMGCDILLSEKSMDKFWFMITNRITGEAKQVEDQIISNNQVGNKMDRLIRQLK
ncbi:MAG: hypothetical protein GY928_17360 [Colwellia sp.]|nr:hypothetical protein [Colwellia sp.]